MKEELDYNKDWSEYFRVDAESPSGLVKIKSITGKVINKFNIGTRKFNKNKKTSGWQLSFRGRLYLIHRIIWVLTYGFINPELVIDHLDGDPCNNRLINLQLKTQANNARNRRKRSDNTSGITGVRIMTTKQGYKYYQANWQDIDGRDRKKYFSIDELGYELAESLAKDYREKQISRLISEGADYTERNGK